MRKILSRAKRVLGSREGRRKVVIASGVTKIPAVRRWVFNAYYDKNSWGDPESRSGGGSNFAQTEVIRRGLSGLFERWQIGTLLDVPCGDGHWWADIEHHLKEYTGVDIVPEMVAARKASARPGERFECLDASADDLPRADAILCRDLLVHFSYDLALETIANFQRSGADYLIATTFSGDFEGVNGSGGYTCKRTNSDIKTGRWRPLDLTAPPFNFPQPLELLVEGCTEADGLYADKSLGVWRLSDLPAIRRSAPFSSR